MTAIEAYVGNPATDVAIALPEAHEIHDAYPEGKQLPKAEAIAEVETLAVKEHGSSVVAEPPSPVATHIDTASTVEGEWPDLAIDDNDNDSAVCDINFVSSTASVDSILYEHVEENGRTYHRYKEGKYLLPNDEKEQNRLDLQHHLSLLTLHGALHLAPIKEDLHNVLDFGTGTGIWAIEFAEKYPSANVLGTDLSPIQPQYTPPNCRFEVDDCEDEWLYSQKFDYIHARFMVTCFKDPANVFRNAFESCKPGGYFEIQDAAFPLRCLDDSLWDTALWRVSGNFISGAKALGKDITHVQKYKQYMIDAGFEDVQEIQFQWPINTWPKSSHHKQLGLWYHQNLIDGLSGITMAIFTRGLGMGVEEVEMLLEEARADLRNKDIHAYTSVYVVYGRKPE